MRFLHPKWNPHLLAISVIELCLSCLPLRATEPLHRVSVVVGPEAGKVDVYLLDEISSDPSNRVGCAGRATADRGRQPIE